MELIKRVWRANIKHQMIVTLAVIAIASMFYLGTWLSLLQLGVGMGVAVLFDGCLSFFRHRKILFSTSAIITGLIIGLVLAPNAEWYVTASAALIAIGSKHFIRIGRKHVFNPAALGLLVCLFIFGIYLSWWGGSIYWLVVVAGVLIAIRFGRLQLVLSFIVTQIVILAAYYALMGSTWFNAVTMLNPFFIFVMLLEPKTSPQRKRARFVYGIAAGTIVSLFVILMPTYDPSVAGLCLSNVAGRFISKWMRT